MHLCMSYEKRRMINRNILNHYLRFVLVVDMCEGEGDNESDPDFSKNAGDDEVANSDRGDMGFDGSFRKDRSLYNFSPDKHLPVICSKSTLYHKNNNLQLDIFSINLIA